MSQRGHRFCAYDRANTGTSDKVPGPLNGETTVTDLERLLQKAGIDPPYVLLGASFGGLFAYMYAVEHPDQVTGMVLLDASFPEELDLERHFPADERWNHDEWRELEEQVDQLTAYPACWRRWNHRTTWRRRCPAGSWRSWSRSWRPGSAQPPSASLRSSARST
jgi:pimeloyl-ACP methyl ester carboxylesterase